MNFQILCWFGLGSIIFLVAGILLSSINFKGMRKEKFSVFNHFISELGDPRFAPHKTLFAISLILGGILLIPFIVGFGLYINSTLSKICIIIGIISALSCSLIGVFPEDKVKPHFTIAGIFFIGAVILIFLVSITILIDQLNSINDSMAYIGFSCLIPIAVFVIDTIRLDKVELDRTNEPWDWEGDRPKFWLNPFLEWCAFTGIILWLFFLAISCLLII